MSRIVRCLSRCPSLSRPVWPKAILRGFIYFTILFGPIFAIRALHLFLSLLLDSRKSSHLKAVQLLKLAAATPINVPAECTTGIPAGVTEAWNNYGIVPPVGPLDTVEEGDPSATLPVYYAAATQTVEVVEEGTACFQVESPITGCKLTITITSSIGSIKRAQTLDLSINFLGSGLSSSGSKLTAKIAQVPVPVSCTINGGAETTFGTNHIVPSLKKASTNLVADGGGYAALTVTKVASTQKIEVDDACFTPSISDCLLKLTPKATCSGLIDVTITSSIENDFKTIQKLSLTISQSDGGTALEADVGSNSLLSAPACTIKKFVADSDQGKITVGCEEKGLDVKFCAGGSTFNGCTRGSDIVFDMTDTGGASTPQTYTIKSFRGTSNLLYASATSTFEYTRTKTGDGILNDVTLNIKGSGYGNAVPTSYLLDATPDPDYVYFLLTSGFIPAKISSWTVYGSSATTAWAVAHASGSGNCLVYEDDRTTATANANGE
ncbi:hypothetical protein BDR26DRAFT_996220 [Obelidium mucronatum]|nr:hypothetical protein BDR26DRAFT_996220 [Obelidium mucronatum]